MCMPKETRKVDELITTNQNNTLLDVTVLEQSEDEIDQFFDRYQMNLKDLRFDREEANARLCCDGQVIENILTIQNPFMTP